MIPFLKHVAQYLWKTKGIQLSEQKIIFPNKRSSLYFTQYIKREVNELFVMPECLTINELFASHTAKIIADKLTLSSVLYKSYKHVTQSKEQFADFYPFANLLLGDFDAVDKHLVDTNQLFQNIANLQAMEDSLSYLSEEQLFAVKQFWRSFDVAQHSKQQELFLEMWKALPQVYEHFSESLAKENLSFEGKVFREVIANLKEGSSELEKEQYIFIGFNVLSKAERELFRLLQQQGKATFFWDYDAYFTENKYHEAGRFIGKHIADFPNPSDFIQTEKINADKDITHLQCSSEVQQTKVLGEMLTSLSDEELSQTAVILANEALLPTVLSSLPKELEKVNISMGFPLKETAFMRFLELLQELHKTMIWQGDNAAFSTNSIRKLLQHSYGLFFGEETAAQILKLLNTGNKSFLSANEFHGEFAKIFTPIRTQKNCYSYLKELLDVLFGKVTQKADIELMKQTNLFAKRLSATLEKVSNTNINFFWTLLIKDLEQKRMPFLTQKDSSLQLIGFLETRLLDFKNVFVLSANEDFLPNVQLAGSLIPYNLRIGAGLPTLDEQNSMFAYYFYRLLSRVEKMTLFSVAGSEDMKCKEQSRYITQLKYEAPFTVKEQTVSADLQWMKPVEQKILKDEKVQEAFEDYFSRKWSISPSAINTYLRCPQRFYYKYIARVPEVKSQAKADDSNMFGTIFHQAAELLYRPYVGEIISKELLEKIGEKRAITKLVLEAFQTSFFEGEQRELKGKELLILDTLVYFMQKLIKRDLQYAPFRIVALEAKMKAPITFALNNGTEHTVSLAGSIDRIDEKEGRVRIIDYKTGRIKRTLLDLEHLFIPCDANRNNTALQTFFYSWLYLKNTGKYGQPSVYQLANIEQELDVEFKIGEARKGEPFDFESYAEEYEVLLKQLLADIFGNEPCFFPAKDAVECEHDAHSGICTVFGLT